MDQIYDGLLANGVRPFIELSFMPNLLAAGPPADFFWYRLNPSPPKDYARWGAMIAAFVSHLLARYGASEVEKWYFEVWNEPNLPFWTGKPAEETYYALYDLTARIIRRADPKLRVGGPATAQAAWIDRFIAHCLMNNVPFDFVSTHICGNESPKDVFGTNAPVNVEGSSPFYGGFGLIAERGIPKPAFRAFELLHSLGDQRLGSEAGDSLVTRKPDGSLAIAIWNYAGPGQAGRAKTVELRLKDGRNPRYIMRTAGPDNGSLDEWIRMGKPDSPTRQQIARLIAASEIGPPGSHRLVEPVKLSPHELALVEIRP